MAARTTQPPFQLREVPYRFGIVRESWATRQLADSLAVVAYRLVRSELRFDIGEGGQLCT